MVFLNLCTINALSGETLPGGKTAPSMVMDFCAALPDVERIIPLALTIEQKKMFINEKIDSKVPLLEENRQDFLLKIMAEEAASSGCDLCFYFYGDTPLLDGDVFGRMYENHRKYYADYSFADGYPLGLVPEIISPAALGELHKLIPEKKEEIQRDSLFSWIQKDINSFDIETSISPVDLRMKRITLATDSKVNFLQLKSFMEQGILTAGDFMEAGESLEDFCRTLPVYFQLQISSVYIQSPSYGPSRELSGEGKDEAVFMDLGEVLELCRRIEDYSPQARVSLSLRGEPAAHPEIFTILARLLEETSLHYLIETSGCGWSCQEEGSSPVFRSRRIDWIVYLDALEPRLYRRLRGPGQEEALAFTEHLLEVNPRHTWVQAVRMLENEDDLEGFYRHWKKKTDHVIIQKYDHFCGLLPQRKVTDLSPLNRCPCWHLKREMAILADGKVVLCQEDLHNTVSLGNWHKETLEEIWEKGRPFMEEQEQGVYRGICGNCDEYYCYNF